MRKAIEVNQDPLLSPAEIVYQNCPAYPRFILGRREDGAPTFELDLNGVQDPGATWVLNPFQNITYYLKMSSYLHNRHI